MNPLSTDLGVMRQTLVFGGLESLARNINRKRENLRFFEVGNVYCHTPEKDNDEAPIKAYTQQYHIALWLTGKRVEGSWAHADEESSFYELKAYVGNILSRAGLPAGLALEQKTTNNLFAYGLALKTRQEPHSWNMASWQRKWHTSAEWRKMCSMPSSTGLPY